MEVSIRIKTRPAFILIKEIEKAERYFDEDYSVVIAKNIFIAMNKCATAINDELSHSWMLSNDKEPEEF